jgi:hypothetical protein
MDTDKITEEDMVITVTTGMEEEADMGVDDIN